MKYNRYAVDGTLPDGSLNADACAVAPFWVHDADAQNWVAGPFRWRWRARLACWAFRSLKP